MRLRLLPAIVTAMAGMLTLPPGAAQIVEEFPLRPATTAGTAQSVEEVVYRSGNLDDRGFNCAVQKIAVPTLTVHRPVKPAPRGAAVVVCPGGGYSYVTIDREGHAIARYLVQHGITVAVLKYRLPAPEGVGDALPLPQADALTAIQWLRSRAGEWGFDARRVGILGFSAGGHLAGCAPILGVAEEGSRPDFAALIYPVVSMEGEHAHAGSRLKLLGPSPSPAQVEAFSLERRARTGLPPFFLAHARDDRGVPPRNSELLAEALREKAVPVELLLVASGGHGFGVGADAESSRWKEAFLRWLAQLP